MEYNLDNIEEFFEGLNSGLNPKAKKMMVWAGYQRDLARRDEEAEVNAEYKDGYGYSYFATKVTEDIFVVSVYKDGEIRGFIPYVREKNNKCNLINKTFDEAVIAALCLKYDGKEDAAGYIFRMIGV